MGTGPLHAYTLHTQPCPVSAYIKSNQIWPEVWHYCRNVTFSLWLADFLTSAEVGGEFSASRPCRLNPGEKATGIHWVGGWVGSRADLDDVEKRKILLLTVLELQTLGRPARN
jgi:hypothetical protein